MMTAIVGWHWFDAATYAANWNTADTTDGHAIIKSCLLYTSFRVQKWQVQPQTTEQPVCDP